MTQVEPISLHTYVSSGFLPRSGSRRCQRRTLRSCIYFASGRVKWVADGSDDVVLSALHSLESMTDGVNRDFHGEVEPVDL